MKKDEHLLKTRIYTSEGLTKYQKSSAKKIQYTKEVHNKLIEKFNDLKIEHIELEGNNIWCRDYLPVKGTGIKYVLFKYKPLYNLGTDIGGQQIKDAEIARKDWIKKNTSRKIIESELILDGGAIEVFDSICIISTRVFRDNPGRSIEKIEQELKKLGIKKVYFIPEHPYDFTGHVDGLARLVDSKTILINDLSKEYELATAELKTPRGKLIMHWINSFMAAIHTTGLEVKEITYTAYVNSGMDATGVYLNYLKLKNHIFVPSFYNKDEKEHIKEADWAAQLRLKEVFPECSIHVIPASELAKQGGIINCVTWQDEQ